LERRGFSNDKDFSQALRKFDDKHGRRELTFPDCDLQTASRVAAHFRKEGILKAAPGSKAKGFGRTGKPRFVVNETKETRSHILQQYFDPMKKIAHHVRGTSPQ
jgi:hypothetical protein